MRLIDADALELELFDADWMVDNDEHMVQDILWKQPTIDAVPVVHAGWKREGYSYVRPKCTACNHRNNAGFTKYCPNCGAKMDGGAE